jgi:hypothetical protein
MQNGNKKKAIDKKKATKRRKDRKEVRSRNQKQCSQQLPMLIIVKYMNKGQESTPSIFCKNELRELLE